MRNEGKGTLWVKVLGAGAVMLLFFCLLTTIAFACQLAENGREDREVFDLSAAFRPRRLHAVTVLENGRSAVVRTYGASVGEILDALQVDREEDVLISWPRDTETFEGMIITVERIEKTVLERRLEKTVPSVRIEDPELPEGLEEVMEEGTPAIVLRRTLITSVNGQILSQGALPDRILQAPRPALVRVGTGKAPDQRPPAGETAPISEGPEPEPYGRYVTTASGASIPYLRSLSVEATAYSCEGRTGITATGTTARYGAIAVDPAVIPYGTRMYILSDDGAYVYGYATAEDCGGAIQGNRIDLYFDTVAECFAFGRRSCTVYILE